MENVADKRGGLWVNAKMQRLLKDYKPYGRRNPLGGTESIRILWENFFFAADVFPAIEIMRANCCDRRGIRYKKLKNFMFEIFSLIFFSNDSSMKIKYIVYPIFFFFFRERIVSRKRHERQMWYLLGDFLKFIPRWESYIRVNYYLFPYLLETLVAFCVDGKDWAWWKIRVNRICNFAALYYNCNECHNTFEWRSWMMASRNEGNCD